MASNAKPAVDQPEITTELAETSADLESHPDEVNIENEELTDADRFQQRVERFGKIAPEEKKLSRAQRFGTPHEAIDGAAKKRRMERFGALPNSAEGEQEKKKSRSERFNVNTPTSAIDEETKQKRIGRFGVVTPSTPPSKNKPNGKSAPTTPALTEAIKKRAERFGDVAQVAKANTANEQKAKRTERFKPITSV